MSYFQSLRVECAMHLLKTTKASVEEIAAQAGYMDGGLVPLGYNLDNHQLIIDSKEAAAIPV